MSDRLEALQAWLEGLPQLARLGPVRLTAASADASFRRYYRLPVALDGCHLLAVDAPPATENNRAFVDIAALIARLGLNAPQVLASDLEQGYLLISDLGRHSYLDQLAPSNVGSLYSDAIDALLTLQAGAPVAGLPSYDAAMLRRELGIFDEWYLGAHCGIEAGHDGAAMLHAAGEVLIASALEQPRVFVHRDYHSRNLLVCPDRNPGIIDFQDAVTGPLTYDLVSLLRDCYIAWPVAQVRDWALDYRDLALRSGVLSNDDETRFLRWFDLMGMQRHLKAIGIFARLKHRDGRANYLADIPRTLTYVEQVAADYPELGNLSEWLAEHGASAVSA